MLDASNKSVQKSIKKNSTIKKIKNVEIKKKIFDPQILVQLENIEILNPTHSLTCL